MRIIDPEELIAAIGLEAFKQHLERPFTRKIRDKLWSDECDAIIATSWGLYLDDSFKEKHKHFSIKTEYTIDKDFRKRFTSLNERLPLALRIMDKMRLTITQADIKSVIIYDSCEEFDMARNSAELSCRVNKHEN